MNSKVKKALIVSAKVLIAGALLSWVLSKTHWNDYVTSAEGKTYAVLERHLDRQPPQLRVQTGWNRSEVRTVDSFVSDGGQVIRPGFATSLRTINVGLLLLAIGGFLGSVMIIAVRWWFLLRLQRIRVPLWEVIRLTFLGQFFNAVVPGTVGGDLVKAYYVSKHTPQKAAVLVSIFVDRILGLTEMTLLAVVMILCVLAGGWESFDAIRNPAISVAVVVGIVVVAMTFLLSSRFRSVFHLQKIYQRLPIAHHIEAAGDAAVLYRKRIRYLLEAMAMTFGAHVLFVGAIALLGLSLDLPVAWYKYFVYIPLIYIIGAIPITPGGVGLVEKLYLAYFAVNPSLVLAMALLARLIPILLALPGAVVAITGPKIPKANEMEKELGV